MNRWLSVLPLLLLALLAGGCDSGPSYSRRDYIRTGAALSDAYAEIDHFADLVKLAQSLPSEKGKPIPAALIDRCYEYRQILVDAYPKLVDMQKRYPSYRSEDGMVGIAFRERFRRTNDLATNAECVATQDPLPALETLLGHIDAQIMRIALAINKK